MDNTAGDTLLCAKYTCGEGRLEGQVLLKNGSWSRSPGLYYGNLQLDHNEMFLQYMIFALYISPCTRIYTHSNVHLISSNHCCRDTDFFIKSTQVTLLPFPSRFSFQIFSIDAWVWAKHESPLRWADIWNQEENDSCTFESSASQAAMKAGQMNPADPWTTLESAYSHWSRQSRTSTTFFCSIDASKSYIRR